jgi:CHAT domain-containing protein
VPATAFRNTEPLRAVFVPPPRNISDITAILDQEKPDPTKAARIKAEADANPPASKDPRTLADFYYQRAQARQLAGRPRDAIADCEKTIQYEAALPARRQSRCEGLLADIYFAIGDFKRAVEIDQALSEKYLLSAPGRLFGLNWRIIKGYVSIGNIDEAEASAKRSEALLQEAKAWKNFDVYGSSYEGFVASGNAFVLDARGQYAEAERGYRRAQGLFKESLTKTALMPVPPVRGSLEGMIDQLTELEGRAKARQGRLAEAEADLRRALLSRLHLAGKYHASTAWGDIGLAGVLREQARFAEAEQLSRAALEIYQALGRSDSEPDVAAALNELATNLVAQRRWAAASDVYARLDEGIKGWEPARRGRLRLDWGQIFVRYFTRRVNDGIELARTYLERNKRRTGEQSFGTGMAHAILATGLSVAGQDEEALREYRAALPILLAFSRDDEDDDTAAVAADERMRIVLEGFLALIARQPALAGDAPQISEMMRGRAVQDALMASSARTAVRDPALAGMVREEQDVHKQISAQLVVLTNMLALPAGERDDHAIEAQRSGIDRLKAQRATLQRDIRERFPDYGNLTAPKPATLAEVRQALRPGEAFVSIYLGLRNSFVWAVPKEVPVSFARINANADNIAGKVKTLRRALEPEAVAIDQIPPFDLTLAHELYALLLQPVEAGWKSASSLIVVANGALGELPLSLLPTAPVQLREGGVPFAGYRDVPWLARSHAVTMVPSAAALIALRRLPAGPAQREKLIGFGDPIFNEEEAREATELTAADTGPVVRGARLRLRASPGTETLESARLASLPRLPDTALELKAIARTLGVDPSKLLYLGKDANERNVETADLSRFRIIDFATHGLVPGDLDGPSQPALALTAPAIAGVGGDGLLTMEKILALKLDADWVVLSACNTAAGAGAGADAASGLARAFFYAGTRAVLVTNWSVESGSERELMTDLFRRQNADPGLTRAEALRQATLAMLDGPGFTDAAGKPLFSYAHPFFWAPYSIIGDGGGSQ